MRSMTAFGRQTLETGWGHACFEIRTVNHRHSELSFRLDECARVLEPTLRKAVGEIVQRGRAECTLHLTFYPNKRGIVINFPVLREVLTACDQVLAETRSDRQAMLNPVELLHWPDVIKKQAAPPKPEQLQTDIMALVRRTLEELQSTRDREGQKLHDLIISRVDSAQALLDTAQQKSPGFIEAQGEKMRARAQSLGVALDTGRLEQELLSLTQKYDVTEELDRLAIHLHELGQVLERQGPVGRRLDFLIQELHREANTLGAKAVHVELTTIAVELKVLIEQMREQIQNVE